MYLFMLTLPTHSFSVHRVEPRNMLKFDAAQACALVGRFLSPEVHGSAVAMLTHDVSFDLEKAQ